MAKGFSKAVVMGNLTRDPETKQTNSGHSVISFTLAVNGRNDDVAYIDCTAWNKGGETIAQYHHYLTDVLPTRQLVYRCLLSPHPGTLSLLFRIPCLFYLFVKMECLRD